jgi:transcription initiation factor TFIIB
MGLSTIIGKPYKNAGSVLNAAMRSTFDRLRTWDFRVKGQDERSLRRAFVAGYAAEHHQVIRCNSRKDCLHPPAGARARACTRPDNSGNARGSNLYCAEGDMGVSGTFDDIIKATNTKEKDLARAYRILLRELDLKVSMLDPIKCVSRVPNRANISERITRRAIDMIHDVVKRGEAAGKDPRGLAASVLYLACVGSKEPKSQETIAEAAGISEVTLRKNQRMIMGIRQQPAEAIL